MLALLKKFYLFIIGKSEPVPPPLPVVLLSVQPIEIEVEVAEEPPPTAEEKPESSDEAWDEAWRTGANGEFPWLWTDRKKLALHFRGAAWRGPRNELPVANGSQP